MYSKPNENVYSCHSVKLKKKERLYTVPNVRVQSVVVWITLDEKKQRDDETDDSSAALFNSPPLDIKHYSCAEPI